MPIELTAPDLDALIDRINALADCSYWANAGWDIPGDATQVIGRLAVQAAAALVQLRDENARLTQHRYTDAWREATDRAERAEAEVLILRNDLATYAERIAALEAERDALKHDAERYRWLRAFAVMDAAKEKP